MKRLFFLLTILSGILAAFSFSPDRGKFDKENPSKNVYINIRMPDARNTDTFTLFIYKNILTPAINDYLPYSKQITLKGKDGLFHFKINNVIKPEYIVLSKDKDTLLAGHKPIPILNLYLIQPGDSVNMNILWDSTYHADKHLIPFVLNNKKMIAPEIVRFPAEKYIFQYTIHFSGRGAAKYNCRYQIDKADRQDSMEVNMKILSNYRKAMNPLAYGVLKADIIGAYEKIIYVHKFLQKGNIMRTVADSYFNHLPAYKDISNQAKSISRYYPKAILLRQYYKFPTPSNADIYKVIKGEYTGELRDKLITIYLTEKKVQDSILRDAMQVVTTDFCLKQIDAIFNSQVKGKTAFNFSLPDSSGKLISLSDFKGKVVLIDFWFTGCHACSELYQNALSQVEKKYKDNPDVKFITISIDIRKRTWLNSIQGGHYTSQDIINLYTAGMGDKNLAIIQYHVIAYPKLYIIDKKGHIFSTGISNKSEIEKSIQEALQW